MLIIPYIFTKEGTFCVIIPPLPPFISEKNVQIKSIKLQFNNITR